MMGPSAEAYACELERIVGYVCDGEPLESIDTWLTLSEADKEYIISRANIYAAREMFDIY